MKILYKILFGTALMLLLVASCAKEQHTTFSGEDATLTLNVGTRAGEELGDPEDRYINSLRVIGYNTADGQLAFNEKVLGIPTASTDNDDAFERTINVKTGNFTIIFIANEHETPATSALLEGITSSNNNTLSYLKTSVSFPHQAFDAGKDIPMVTVKENITIQGDDMVVDPDSPTPTAVLNKWPVSMERLGIRIDLTLQLLEVQREAWQNDDGKVYFSNVPDKVFLFPGTANAPGTIDKTYTMLDYDNDTKTVFNSPRIILPEVYLSGLTKSDALTMMVKAPTEFKGAISPDGGTTYALRRNTRLGVTAQVGEMGLTFNIIVEEWVDEDMGGHELQ